MSRNISVVTGPQFKDMTLGESYFEAFGRLPGAEFIVNVPAAGSVEEAKEVVGRYWGAVGEGNMKVS